MQFILRTISHAVQPTQQWGAPSFASSRSCASSNGEHKIFVATQANQRMRKPFAGYDWLAFVFTETNSLDKRRYNQF